MEVIVSYKISELSQEFMHSPKIERKNKDITLLFDYETETGEYKWTGITFANTIEYKHTNDNSISEYMVKAYNAVAEVKHSSWLNENRLANANQSQRFKHFLVYFDGYGAYEFISTDFYKVVE